MIAASWLLLLLPAAVLSGWIGAVWQNKTFLNSKKGKKQLPSGYFRGLNFLLNEQPEQAIDAFKIAVNNQIDTIDAQLTLGHLFRRRGELEKATILHENLLYKTQGDRQLHALALYELAQDYQKAGLFDRAESLYLQLLNGKFQKQAAGRHLLQIYEQEKEWERAISVIDKQPDRSSVQIKRNKSHYYSELIELSLAEGRFDQARSLVSTARAFDNDNVRLRIQSGRIAAAFAEHQQALIDYKYVVEINSLYVREVVALIANSYIALNDLLGLSDYLEYLVETHRSTTALLLLVDRVKADSGPDFAQKKLTTWLRLIPSLPGVNKLLELKLSDTKLAKENKNDIALLVKLLEKVIKVQASYQCRQCGFSGGNFYWQCPTCRKWDSIKVQRNIFT